ncbi:KCNB2 [Symbiodinium natans]|uniref:KCNB2 protein n=1 Tax=Symbiodinium natans TaxID=878477 RepID=A0A812LQM2_9DINO|nr:KCNB2 [Symbiodinium natans]
MPQHHPTPGEVQPTPDHELITAHTTYKKAPKWSFPGRLSGDKPSGTEVGHYSGDDKHRDINGRYKRDPSWSMRFPKDFRSSSLPPGPGRYNNGDGALRYKAPSWGFGSSSKEANIADINAMPKARGFLEKETGASKEQAVPELANGAALVIGFERTRIRVPQTPVTGVLRLPDCFNQSCFVVCLHQLQEHKTESASAEDAARTAKKQEDGEFGHSPRGSRDTDRPFYTHTLGLTYVSSTQKRMEEEGKTTAEKIFVTLSDPGSSSAAQIVSILIVAFTVTSICGFVLETDRTLYEMNPDLFPLVEVICTVVFTVEYLMLALTCRFVGVPIVKFILAPSSVADLVALLPFYVEVGLRSAGFTNTAVLKSFKVVRLIRVLRVFKLGRYAAGLQIMWKAVVDSRQAISVLLFLLGIGVVMFSSTIFYLERLSCPMRDGFSAIELTEYLAECNDTYNRGVSPSHGLCCTEDNSPVDFPSIVTSCWWAVVTLTSLGYGDLYPKTIQGKCVGMMAMIAGLLLIALPIAIISQKFQDIYEASDKEDAKNRAAQRMKGAPHETWTLIPGSDVIRRLKALPIKDDQARDATQQMVKCLEEMWERREALGRERKYALTQTNRFHKAFDKFETQQSRPRAMRFEGK